MTSFLSLYRCALELLARAPSGEVIDPLVVPPPPLASFFLLCLLRAARTHATVVSSTNPTWMRPGKRRVRLRGVNRSRYIGLATTFRETVKTLTVPLAQAPLPAGEPGHATIRAGDARRLPAEDNSVDFVLTSPPYCTRLDYPVSTSLELAALGMSTEGALRDLRYASMGTPLIRRARDQHDEPPADVQNLIERIATHPSKNSDTYYASTYRQYFDDAYRSLRELRRVLRVGGRAVLVLQTSFYKDIAIPLPALYITMGNALGFRGEVVHQFPVQRVLTTINGPALRHLAERQYFESVIALGAA